MRRETTDARKADTRHETIDVSQVSRLKPRRVSGLMSHARQSKISIRFYNDREVRAIWDDAASKWWFSVLDIVAAVNHEPDYAKTRNYWKWLKAKLKREDCQLVSATTQLKLNAPVKEAIVNAIVHRDYTSLASVQVMLFKDRLEVWSPGGLPHGMTIKKLSTTHKSMPVNPFLARAMYLKGYIEKAGTGTEDMIAKCAEWGIPTPEWIEDDDDFRVVLRRPNCVNVEQTGGLGSDPTTTQRTTQQTTQRMLLKLMPEGNMRNIVSLVMKNPKINIAGMAHVLGLSQNGIKYHIKQIRKKIAFKHVGPWNAGHWEIGLKETP